MDWAGHGEIKYRMSQRLMPHLRITGAVVSIVILLAGCSSDETFLPELLDDPMAQYEAPGLNLVDSRHWKKSSPRPWPLLSKPAGSSVRVK